MGSAGGGAGSPEIQPLPKKARIKTRTAQPDPGAKSLGFISLGSSLTLSQGICISISMLAIVALCCFSLVRQDLQVRVLNPARQSRGGGLEVPEAFDGAESPEEAPQEGPAGAQPSMLPPAQSPAAQPGDPGLSRLEQGGGPASQGISKVKLGLFLTPLRLANATDTIDIRPEDYRVPDAHFCGKVLRAEPDVRVPEIINGPACSCKDKCNDLDFPHVSYLFNGFKSKDQLRKALSLVYVHHAKRYPLQPLETIVRAAPGLSFEEYIQCLKAVKPNDRDIKPLMLDSYFLERGGQPSEEHAPGLARMANAPTIMHVGPAVAEESQLPPLRDRKQYIESLSNCNGELEVALLIQYFRRPGILPNLLKRLKQLPGKAEIMINNDSASEIKTFQKLLGGSRYTLLVSGDIHEIRGYNRLSKLVHSKILVVLQDDDMPPVKPRWLDHAATAFSNNHRLGFIGGFTGTIQGGPQTGKFGVGRSKISHKAANGRPFMFVTLTNIGPFVMRQDLFWYTGMFNMNYSCRGDPGIGFDYEYSLRTWYKGYQVGLFNPEFIYHYGNALSSGTRSNRALYKRRMTIEKRNSVYHKSQYSPPRRNHYFRQGLPGRDSAFKTTRDKLKGVGIQVHDANDFLKKNPSFGGGPPQKQIVGSFPS